jgi:hypothetical protein
MRSFILLLAPVLLAGSVTAQVQPGRAAIAPEAADLAPFSTIQPTDFEGSIPEFVRRRTEEFMGINLETVEFFGKVPFAAQPIYAYGVDEVAYYEVWLTEDGRSPKGWLLISATDRDYPLVNFSHDGTPYSQKVLGDARQRGAKVVEGDRIYRFGVSYFSIETAQGERIGEFGDMPSWLPGPVALAGSGQGDSDGSTVDLASSVEAEEWVHYLPVTSYDDLRAYFADSYFTPRRAELAEMMRVRIFPKSGHGEAYQGEVGPASYIFRWITSYDNQALYTQIPANYQFNWTSCWSGCNNNAWTSLYAWWDKNMGKGNLIQTTSTGETCPTLRNTLARQVVTDPVQMWFRGICATYCNDGGGWTKWSKAYKGHLFAPNQGYSHSYKYQWCNSTGCDVDLAEILIECIGNDLRPAHIGANAHFYVGTGLAQWDTNTDWTWVYGYPGWSQDHSDDVFIWWHDLNASTRVYVY